MGKALLTAAALVLTLGATSQAADLGNGEGRPAQSRPAPEAVIVVPGCDERGAGLIRCEPRDNLFFPADTDLVVIERSIPDQRRRPYPELFPWQR